MTQAATDSIAAQKQAMRAACRAARPPTDPAAGDRLATVALARLDFAGTVAGVWPLPGEMDLRPLLTALHARGHPIVLPETPPLGQALTFRLWTPGCTMLRERFATWRPDGPHAEPDMLLVPLLAFDSACHRLGYGGGYYDRTLAAQPGRRAIGFGYAAQQVAQVPTEPHDQTLDAILTEHTLVTRP